MNYLHVVNGDLAARLLGEVLEAAGRRDSIVVLRDDLAFGPLRSIDESNSARIAFWQRALDAGEHGLSQTIIDAFEASTQALRGLARDDGREVVAWHAQNAGDQLMLRRVAYHLRNAPQRLNEIGMPTRSLGGSAKDAAPGEQRCTPDAMAARLHAIAPISLLRIGRLALEWQELKQLGHEVRRWRDNTFQSAAFSDIDGAIIELATLQWQSYLSLAQRIRAVDPGSVATDALIAWRCRELAALGRIALDGDPILEKSTRIRLTQAARAPAHLAC
ncbi:MAG: DUF1835 domain-containing protein [Janthinobacterium lividum]